MYPTRWPPTPHARRHVLAKLLQGGMLQEDPEAMREWEELNRHLQPPEDFQMRVGGCRVGCRKC